MAWTYILRCADDSVYTGSTKDLDVRLAEHEQGLGAAYTRTQLPVQLLAAFEFDHIDDALHFEKKLQRWSRAKKLAFIEGRFDDIGAFSQRGFRPRISRPADSNPNGRGQGPNEMRRWKPPAG